MKLSEEQIKSISDYAELLFTPKQVAIIMELDIDSFCKACQTVDNPIGKAYMKGQLMTEAAIRQSIIFHAKNGSASAQKDAERRLIEIKKEMLRYG